MAGVDADSLAFCFEALVKGTDLDPLELEIGRAAADELEFAYLELEEPMTRVPMEGKVLNENQVAWRRNCAPILRATACFAVNLISSPGSGKTALLERTLESFAPGRARGRAHRRHPDR